MSHLAAGAGLVLAVDVDMGTALGDELGPAPDLRSDEIFHDGAAAHEPGDAGRQIADRADMLLELRRDRAFDRPVAAVVNARSDFVDQRAVRGGEKFDGEHSDMAERLGNAESRGPG